VATSGAQSSRAAQLSRHRRALSRSASQHISTAHPAIPPVAIELDNPLASPPRAEGTGCCTGRAKLISSCRENQVNNQGNNQGNIADFREDPASCREGRVLSVLEECGLGEGDAGAHSGALKDEKGDTARVAKGKPVATGAQTFLAELKLMLTPEEYKQVLILSVSMIMKSDGSYEDHHVISRNYHSVLKALVCRLQDAMVRREQ
jgi:hypothetical protein